MASCLITESDRAFGARRNLSPLRTLGHNRVGSGEQRRDIEHQRRTRFRLWDNLCTITHAHERSSFSPWPTRASHQEAYSSCLITIANELRQRPPYGDAGKNLEHGAEPQRHGCRLLCVREAAVEALGSLGEHAVPHAGAIAARLEDDDGDVRRAAVEALGRLGEHAGQHAGAIAILLEDANAGVRRAAVEALWRLGEHAVPDAGAVAARLEDANADVT
ncbi:hypothetical protein CYMTET_22274 [Cymbomonas tetramitiformis]|uniref:HEAT repeat domain-containing protein n=1 Tax=Cymbomonas tetramitiformis TaxID=36881 RepID=A0AAE0G0H3_9CHLO|nr:hypothetical protein CYMTET_22274 [Cymbomonas tetramitiformis]